MKKISIPLFVIVVLAAAWLGVSWYSGQRAQAVIGEGVARLNNAWSKSDPQRLGLQIKPVSYQRGLLSTHARYALSANALPEGQAPEMDLTIWHGPFPHGLTPKRFALHAELATTGFVKEVADAAMKGQSPLAFDLECAYDDHCAFSGGVPAVEYTVPIAQIKLAFGGMQMKANALWHSETDYQMDGSAQILPLSVNGEDFGDGQWVFSSTAQKVDESFSWKTGAGESKVSMAVALTQPIDHNKVAAFKTPEETVTFLAGLVNTASMKISLSKPMLVDIGAHATHLIRSADPIAARQQISEQLDALTSSPEASGFIQVKDDTITSDWQYAGGKLTINGQDHSDLLAQIKNSSQRAMQAQKNPTGQ